MSAVQQKTAHVTSLASPTPIGTVPTGFNHPDASSVDDTTGSSAAGALPEGQAGNGPAMGDVRSDGSPHLLSPLAGVDRAGCAAATAHSGPSAWVEAVNSKANGSSARGTATGSHMPDGIAQPAHPLGPFHDFPDSQQASGSQQSEGQQGLIPLGDAPSAAWAHLHRSPTKFMSAGPACWASPARSDASAVSIGPRGSPFQGANDPTASCSDDEDQAASPKTSHAAHSMASPSPAQIPGSHSDAFRLQLGREPTASAGGGGVSGTDSPTHSAGSLSRAASGLSEAVSISPRAGSRPRTARALLSRLALPGDGVELALGGGSAWPSPSGSASEASWSIAVPTPRPTAADSPTHGDCGAGSPPPGTSTAEWAGFGALASPGPHPRRSCTARNSMAVSLDAPAGLGAAQDLPESGSAAALMARAGPPASQSAAVGFQAAPEAEHCNELDGMRSVCTPAAACVAPATPMHEGTPGAGDRYVGSPTSTQSSALFATPMAGLAATPSSSWRGQASSMASGSMPGYATPMATLEPPTPCSATPTAATADLTSPQDPPGQRQSWAPVDAADSAAVRQTLEQAARDGQQPAVSNLPSISTRASPSPARPRTLQIPDGAAASKDDSPEVSPRADNGAVVRELQSPGPQTGGASLDASTALLWCHETIDDDLPGPSLPMSLLGPPPIYPMITSPSPACSSPIATSKVTCSRSSGAPKSDSITPAAALEPSAPSHEQATAASHGTDVVGGGTPLPPPACLSRAQSTPGSGDWYRRIMRTFDPATPEGPGRPDTDVESAAHLSTEVPSDGGAAFVPEDPGKAVPPGMTTTQQVDVVCTISSASAACLEPHQEGGAGEEHISTALANTPENSQAMEAGRLLEADVQLALEHKTDQQNVGILVHPQTEDGVAAGRQSASAMQPEYQDAASLQATSEPASPASAGGQAARSTPATLSQSAVYDVGHPQKILAAATPEPPFQQHADLSGLADFKPPLFGHDKGQDVNPGQAMQEADAAKAQSQDISPGQLMQGTDAAQAQSRRNAASPASIQGQAEGPGRLAALELPTPGVLQAITNTHSPSPRAGLAGNPWEGAQSPSPSGGDQSGAPTGSWWSSSSASNSFRGGCTLRHA